MPKLLKGRKAFLDTSVFEDASFDVSSPSFTEFSQLCREKKLSLLTTDITRREITARIARRAEAANDALTLVSQTVSTLHGPDAAIVNSLTSKLSARTFADAWSHAVDAFFDKCHAKILAVPESALAKVMVRYFERKPPFSGPKKEEFPDAFVLEALDAVRRPITESIYVVSLDNDFAKACEERSRLAYCKSLSELVQLFNIDKISVKLVLATVGKNLNEIQDTLNGVLNNLRPELQGAEGAVELKSVSLEDIHDWIVGRARIFL